MPTEPAAVVADNPESAAPPPPAARDVLRVLHVINGQHYAGAERVQDLLAAGLPALGFAAGFACLKPDAFPRQRQYQAAPLVELTRHGPADLRAAWELAQVVRRDGYRLLHAHTPRSVWTARMAARWAGVPLVYHVHSPVTRDSTRPWRDRGKALAERFGAAGAAHLIAVSESLRQYMIQQGYDAQRISVVPNGVPCRPVTTRPRNRREPWQLGTVALVRPRKGIDVLLRALTLVRHSGSDVRLNVVGPFESPEYARELQQLAADLGVNDLVQWSGFTRDVDAALAGMDVFVLPSLFGEGMPMVVLEAMAAGVPVVATRVEGIPEVIRDRVDGLLATPGSPEDLARAIVTLLDGRADARALAASARQRQEAHFSDRSMAAGVAAVYRRVLL